MQRGNKAGTEAPVTGTGKAGNNPLARPRDHNACARPGLEPRQAALAPGPGEGAALTAAQNADEGDEGAGGAKR